MDDNISELLRQIAFLQAGGGKRTTSQDIIEGLSNVGLGLRNAAQGIESGIDARKKLLESKKIQQELTPISKILNIPEPQAQMNILFRNEAQSNRPQPLSQDEENRRNILENLFSSQADMDAKQADIESKFLGQSTSFQEELNKQRNENLAEFNDLQGRKKFQELKGQITPEGKFQSGSPTETESINRLIQERKQKLAPFGGEQFANVPVDKIKEFAQLSILSGTKELFFNPKTSEVDIIPTKDSIPLAKVPEKTAATILAAKERAKIISNSAEERQNKSFNNKEQLMEKEEEMKPIASAESAGKIALAKESIKNIDEVKQILFPNGKPESFQRNIAIAATIPTPFGRKPIPFNTEAQNVFRKIGASLAGRILIQTGVASRPEEVQSVFDQFAPGITSSPQASFQALNELQNFYKDFIETTLRPSKQRESEESKIQIKNNSLSSLQNDFSRNLFDAAAAISQGADKNAVKQRFINMYPNRVKEINNKLR